MKKTKRLLSMFLTAIMTFAMTTTAFAVETPKAQTTGSITINGTKAKGNFEAYRLFDTDNVDYTLVTEFEGFFKTEYAAEMGTLTGKELSYKAAEKLTTIQQNTAAEKISFSKKVLNWVKAQEQADPAVFANVKTTTPAADTATTIANLPYGFYMIYSPSASGNGTGVEKTPAMMVTVAEPTVSINMKSVYPTVDKNIVPGITDPDDVTPSADNLQTVLNPNWGITHDMGVASISNGGNAGDFQVGDVVTFKLTASVPDMTGYTAYTFKFHDTLSKGLTFQAVQKITVGSTVIAPVQQGQEKVNSYTVALGKTAEGQTLEITMNKFLESYAQRTGETIEVYYKAVVNKDAVVGMDPNTNKVNIEFSNDPNNSTSTESSEDDIVDVHTFAFDIFKFAQQETQKTGLAGAEFILSTDEAGKQIINLKKQADNKTWVVSKEQTNDLIVTPADGRVTIKGLKAGVYYLTETKAPAGYHKLKSAIKVEITPKYNVATGKLESCDIKYTLEGTTVTQTINAGTNTAEVEVLNKKGTLLPNTGGMGTTVFTIVGVILIIGVAASYINSRRKDRI